MKRFSQCILVFRLYLLQLLQDRHILKRNILETHVVACHEGLLRALSARANRVGSIGMILTTLTDVISTCVNDASVIHSCAGSLTRLKGLCPGYIFNTLLHLVEVLTPPVKLAKTSQVERVNKQAVLDLQVQRRVTAKRGRQVHLEQPRLQVLVNHHVKAQQLETVSLSTAILLCFL